MECEHLVSQLKCSIATLEGLGLGADSPSDSRFHASAPQGASDVDPYACVLVTNVRVRDSDSGSWFCPGPVLVEVPWEVRQEMKDLNLCLLSL